MDQRIILILILGLLVMWGCTSLDQTAPQQPVKQFICDDGRTIVSDLTLCPKVDTGMQDCEKASTAADYYGDNEQDACYYNLAVDRGNASICRKVRGDSYSTYSAGKCGAEIAISQGDTSICDSVGLVAKSDCYSEISTQTSDVKVCEKITVPDKRDTCIYNFVSTNSYSISDWSICDQMNPDGYDAPYCYELAAEKTRDLKYCDKLTDMSTYPQSECYATVGKKQNNPSVCGLLTLTSDKDSCYYYYGSTYPYEPSVCSKITDPYQKDNCDYYTNSSRNW